MAAKLRTFVKTVTTAGTRVQLSAVNLFVRECIVQAKANAGNIYLGDETVAASNGLIITGLKSVSISELLVNDAEDYVNLKDVYIDSDSNGEAVIVGYIER